MRQRIRCFPLLLALLTGPSLVGQAGTDLRVEPGVTAAGAATDQWLTMLRKRLPDVAYDSVRPILKLFTTQEAAWAGLIRSRLEVWHASVPALAAPYRPVAPPTSVLIVIGNRGAEDAFTHDPTTIGFDLAALQANYGDAAAEGNRDRMDRFFRHEFVHLMQKAWLVAHPWRDSSPLGAALFEIWTEGLGNYQSLSDRWRNREGRRSEATARALAELEPRFVARLSALACATPEGATALTADLSWGRFDRKWGALPAALWLAEEAGAGDSVLRRFIEAGPAGVWDLAGRHLPEQLRGVLVEVRGSQLLCAGA